MNKKTLALTTEQYELIITTMRTGCTSGDTTIKPNNRIATLLTLQANLGLRLGDTLHLRLCDIVKDGSRRRLDIAEEKTGKTRTFTVPDAVYSYMQTYALDNGIKPIAKLFGDISERAVQKHLKLICDHLGLVGISTHSFRKYFATQIYVNNNYDIELVRTLLQHSTTAVTQRYIGIQPKQIEDALNNHIHLI